MAVPPIERSQAVGLAGPLPGTRYSWLLDLVLGLLIVAALPLAILAIPNTVSLVAGLLPTDMDRLGLIRAHGLALPAMMLTVPLAAVLVQRMKAAPILLVGLAVLAAADAAGGFAGSALVVGVLRVVHGVGAGLLIPALLMAAWERAPLLRALWTGMLAVSLLAAQALALWPLDNARDWRITLQPYPLLSGIALGLAAIYLALSVAVGAMSTPGPRAIERSRLTLTAVPAAGLAVLAIGTTFGWPPALVVLAALFSIAALLTLASIGTFEGPAGRTLSYAMLAVGVVVLPTAAQVTYMELGGVGGPGLNGLWLPFAVCAVAGAGAALVVGLLDSASMQRLSRAGLVTVVLGLCTVRLMVPASEGLTLMVPFVLLAVGAAVALTAALRMTGPGAALYGLSLCFPGVLAGYLLGTGVQMVLLGRPQSAQQLVDRFVGALHLWVLIGGFLVVAVIMLAALLGRRAGARAATATESGAPETFSVEEKPQAEGSDVLLVSGEEAAGRGPYERMSPPEGTGPDDQKGGADRSGAADPTQATAGSDGRADDAVIGSDGQSDDSDGRADDAVAGSDGRRARSDGGADDEAGGPEGRPGGAGGSENRSGGVGRAQRRSGGAAGDDGPTDPFGLAGGSGGALGGAVEDAPTGEVPRVPASRVRPSPGAIPPQAAARDRLSGGTQGEGARDGGAARGPVDGGSPGRSDGSRGSSGSSSDGSSSDGFPSDGSAGDGSSVEGDGAERPEEGTGPMPVVPPPAQSPEDSEPD
ncbi:hypothetical protein GCM10010404_74330 [Nonomuraea africana]|uniref:MFS transporter n=1 Tax=Nonomuraea africana TaxID=46171 RepID=A0ABR9K7R3_9ACTN|nr:hypothetical protein [Nonomuraea africana]MBE1557846.1 hypothetical protein [Nonomuraea africana]